MRRTDTSFRWVAKARASAVFCLAGALVGAGLYAGNRDLFRGPCAGGGSTYLQLSGPTGDCAGYTDGSYVFDPRLADVESDIQQENQQITSQHPADYVSVVMLLPISSEPTTIMSMPDVLDHLRGAYTAQYYANRNNVNGRHPYIQLLIGNAGYQANEESAATSAITGAAASQHIVAVTGLGVSLATTRTAAHTLTTARIPVIGSSISSDSFDNIPDLIRVSPSDKDESLVADKYVRKSLKLNQSVLVEDDNANDIYDSDLATDLDPNHKSSRQETYDTTYRDTPQSTQAEEQSDGYVQNRISQMVPDICAAQPAVVLFAGRGRDLAALVGDLAHRSCSDTPIRIITGDDVVNMTRSAALNQGLDSGVTVDYAALVDKHEWDTGTGPEFTKGRQGFALFESTFQGLFPDLPLTDENLMMSYDATLTAISAIRLSGQPQPTAEAVSEALSALNETHPVPGASGPLVFHTNQDNRSNPVGKAIPMLRYGKNGVPQFLYLSWTPSS